MSEAALKSQIASLQRKLAKLNVGSSGTQANAASSRTPSKRRRMRRSKRSNASAGNPSAGYVAPRVQPTNPRTASKEGGVLSPDGTIRIRRTEFVRAITFGSADKITLKTSSFPWLSGLARNFDRIKWHSCQVRYRPSVGTNEGGQLIMGVDWDSNAISTITMEAVSASTPVFETPVWQGGVMALPSSRLMSRKEYVVKPTSSQDTFDGQPGTLMYVVSGTDKTKEAGHLWVTYDVTLFGTVKG